MSSSPSGFSYGSSVSKSGSLGTGSSPSTQPTVRLGLKDLVTN